MRDKLGMNDLDFKRKSPYKSNQLVNIIYLIISFQKHLFSHAHISNLV